MATEDEAASAPAVASAPEIAPFSQKERFGAGLVGTLLSGAGAVSVFLTQNQAGSVALIAVGGAFLLTAVNGSPLMKAKFKDYELELSRRRRAEVVAEAAISPPEQARQALALLQAVDPTAAGDRAVVEVSGYVYERLIADKIRSLTTGADVQYETRGAPFGRVDVLATYPEGQIAVQVKYVREDRPIARNQLKDQASVLLAAPSLKALLIVTSGQLPRAIEMYVEELEASVGKPVRVVRWSDEQDDAAMKTALDELKAAISGG